MEAGSLLTAPDGQPPSDAVGHLAFGGTLQVDTTSHLKRTGSRRSSPVLREVIFGQLFPSSDTQGFLD